MEISVELRKRLLLTIVYIGLLLDYSLLTTVEPILPHFLLENNANNITSNQKNTSLSRSEQITEESGRLGLLVGSKCLVQVLVEPLIGPLTTRIGFSIPLFFGYVVMIITSILFAFGKSFGVLFLSRAINGIGSACAATAGMGMLAQQYSDDKQRSHYMGIAMGGMALGLLIGPTYGGAMYDVFHGKEVAFLLLAALGCVGAGLQLLVLPPKLDYQKTTGESTSLHRLLMDPRVLIAASSIVVANLGLGVLVPGLQLWMIDKWNSSAFDLDKLICVIFFPSSLAYLAGTTFLPAFSIRLGRWLCVLISLVTISVCLALMSFSPSFPYIFVPITIIGIGISFVDSAMIPLLGHMAYEKHKKEIGQIGTTSNNEMEIEESPESSTYAANAYAISDAGLSIAYFVAPFASGPMVQAIGFRWMTWAFAIGISLFAPLALFLRKASNSARIRTNST